MIQFPVVVPRRPRRAELVVLAAKAQAASPTTTRLRVRVSNVGSLVCRTTLLERGHAVIRARLSVSSEHLHQHGPVVLPELSVELTVDLAEGDVLTLCSRDALPHSLGAVLDMGGCWLVVADRVDGLPDAHGSALTPVVAAPSTRRFVFPNV